MPEGNIFISYRRERDGDTSGRLHDRLERTFDQGQLFFDTHTIPPGVDFAEYIEAEVAKCDVMIVVIGPGWIDNIDRLHEEDDFVRLEIEAALQRVEIPVIPVLVNNVELPEPERLPASLRGLLRRNAVPLRHDQFSQTVDGYLTEALLGFLPQPAADLRSQPSKPPPVSVSDSAAPAPSAKAAAEDDSMGLGCAIILIGAALLAGLVWWLFSGGDDGAAWDDDDGGTTTYTFFGEGLCVPDDNTRQYMASRSETSNGCNVLCASDPNCKAFSHFSNGVCWIHTQSISRVASNYDAECWVLKE